MSGRSDFIENGGHAVCAHEERWTAYKAQLDRIERKLDDQHQRLYIGNGTPALTSVVAKHEQVLTALVWTTGTLVTAMIVAGVGLTVRAIFRGVS